MRQSIVTPQIQCIQIQHMHLHGSVNCRVTPCYICDYVMFIATNGIRCSITALISLATALANILAYINQ